MTQFEIEQYILSCILQKPKLINELFVDINCFSDEYHRRLINFLKRAYERYKEFDVAILTSHLKDKEEQSKFALYFVELLNLLPTTSMFY
jgi:replicative DNA helicase